MAGLFGLFGGSEDQGPQSKEAFFLSEDEAKTYGDIDYMRKEVVIRRTFAKKKGQEEIESVKSISASTSTSVGEVARPATSSFSTYSSTFTTPTPAPSTPAPVAESESPAAPAAEAPAAAETSPTQRTDTSMDLFRSMAKSLRR